MKVFRKYSNIIEAAYWSRVIRKLTGSEVKDMIVTSSNQVKIQYSPVGCIFFILWHTFYIYCSYQAQVEDQSILRNLYSTKLKHYGDDIERISSFVYVLFTMFLIPFRLCFNVSMVEVLLKMDKAIHDFGDVIDYNKFARKTSLITALQLAVYLIRMLCMWFPIYGSKGNITPYAKIFQVAYSDAQAIIITSIYCFFDVILRERFQWINKVLKDIQMRNSWEYKVFLRGKLTPNIEKVVSIQEKYICEKIKTCARIYSMLYHVCGIVNDVFGFTLLITLFHYLTYIVLYLYHFMEATASGLSGDIEKYIDFSVHVFWEVNIALGIIFLTVHHSEGVMKEAKHTSYVLHEIINGDFSEDINNEAMKLSVQLLHERPVFSVLGLFKLDYTLLQQGARSVSTYLVVLLQFATDKK